MNTPPRSPLIATLALALACSFGSAVAQDAEKEQVLKEGQVTADALVDAFAQAAAASSPVGERPASCGVV